MSGIFLFFSCLKYFDESIGTSVKDINSEINTATATVRPNCLKNLPTIPLTIAIGVNTAATAKVVAITAKPISAVPSFAAWIGDLPIFRWREIFSITTIASSIKSPTERDNPIKDIVLSEKSISFSPINVVIIDTGRLIALMAVLHSFKNIKIISIARIHPSSIVCLTSFTESFISVELSVTIWIFTPLGRDSWILETPFFISSATCTVLVPDCLTTSIPMASFPL